MERENVLCPYFKQGCCMYGDKCRRQHDFSAPEDDTCRYYRMGACRWGAKCRYLHERSGGSSNAAQTPAASLTASQCPAAPLYPASLTPTPSSSTTSTDSSKLRISAPEFVPKVVSSSEQQMLSYSHMASVNTPSDPALRDPRAHDQLCPWQLQSGKCKMATRCEYLHANVCEMCGESVLHPFDEAQRFSHNTLCLKSHEEAMHYSFQVQSSAAQTCNICIEVVLSNPDVKKRQFGLLESCNHCFCMSCIMEWRSKHKNDDNVADLEAIRGCPVCRKHTNFVISSKLFPETTAEKEKIFEEFRSRKKKIKCRSFEETNKCPFYDRCFYKHVNEKGEEVKLGLPSVRPSHKMLSLSIQRSVRLFGLLARLSLDGDDDDIDFIFADSDFDSDYEYGDFD